MQDAPRLSVLTSDAKFRRELFSGFGGPVMHSLEGASSRDIRMQTEQLIVAMETAISGCIVNGAHVHLLPYPKGSPFLCETPDCLRSRCV